MNSLIAAGLILAQIMLPNGNIGTPGGHQLDPATGATVCVHQTDISAEFVARFQDQLQVVVTANAEQFAAWFTALSSLINVPSPEGTVAATFLIAKNPDQTVLMLEFDANDCYIGFREIGRDLFDDISRVLRGEQPQNRPEPQAPPAGIIPI